jgi:DNA-directed RNA polymerase subunit beta'
LKDTNLKRSLKKINEKIKIFQHKKIEKNKPNKNITKKIELYIRKLKITNCFLETKTLPQWMTFKFLPVLPPNVRPIIKLEDKKIITTDLNQLYCKIININNKITKLKKMLIQEKYLNNEKSILQESVNELIINNEKIKTKKKLKSITKRIEGKKGRFRENLLGKTVDYSGRSVITIEPKLKLKECTIPEEIALELFQPQIIKCLLNLKIVKTVREAKKKIKLKKIIVIQILKNILEKNLILLNRAPTLHKLGIQAFRAKLNKEKVIQLHPLVCSAFNADFDGDQMGIHIPISLKSQAEARVLMISNNNCASPATGNSNLLLSQDMVLGCYYLTSENNSLNNLTKKIKVYNNIEKIIKDHNNKKIFLHNYLWLIQKNQDIIKKKYIKINKKNKNIRKIKFIRTTVGRIIFNNTIILFL